MNNNNSLNQLLYKSINKQKANKVNICRLNLEMKNNNKISENKINNPKIKIGEHRCNSQPRLFSLLDIQDRYRSKAPSLPNQYKRKIYNNINKLLYAKDNNELKSIPQIEYSNKSNKLNKNKSMLIYDNKDKDKGRKMNKNKSQENITINDYRKQSALVSRKDRLYKPYCWDNAEISEIKKEQRDRLMPEGFEYYEKNIMDYNKIYLRNNYIKTNNNNTIDNSNIKDNKDKNQYILIRKLNHMKQYQSDIFFNKQKEKEKESKNLYETKKIENINRKYKNSSDIFNLKKEDSSIIEKSGEKSYFRKLFAKKENDKNLAYNVSNESQIGWGLRGTLPSLFNYTSTKYHLLNRDIKNIGNTRENIFNESKKISENYNPTHKQKSLCEFIDLSRVSAPNTNNDYYKALNNNKDVFKRKNDINSEYYDIYNKYNSLCDKPFQKFNPII